MAAGPRAGPRLGFEVSQALFKGLKPLGIDPQHFGLLRALVALEGQSQKAVGTRLGIPPNRVVVLVDDLESRGAVKRTKHPDDRRAHALSLTPKWRRLFESALEVAIGIETRLCGSISGSDRLLLLELLTSLTNLSAAPEGVHPGLASRP